MKIFKRIITACMVVAMLASMLALSSCGIFKSKVERMYSKVAEAKSYTAEIESSNGSIQIVKVNTRKLSVCVMSEDKNGHVLSESYLWYDKDEDAYYSARVSANTYYKEEMDKDEFFDTMAELIVPDTSAAFERQVDWEVYEKKKGVYTKVTEDGMGDDKTVTKETIKVQRGTLIETEYVIKNGQTTVNIYKLYDINRTKVEIPDELLELEAKELED